MRERLLVQTSAPAAVSVASLTRTSTTATLTTSAVHGYLVGDYVTVAGSGIAGWNAKWKLLTVPTPTTATFTVPGSLTTPATGTMTVIYTSNAQGGRGANGAVWRDVVTVSAEAVALSADEFLQIQQVTSDVRYRFRVHVRADLEPTMRLLWTPVWPAGMAQKTLTLLGIRPDEARPYYALLEASEVTS